MRPLMTVMLGSNRSFWWSPSRSGRDPRCRTIRSTCALLIVVQVGVVLATCPRFFSLAQHTTPRRLFFFLSRAKRIQVFKFSQKYLTNFSAMFSLLRSILPPSVVPMLMAFLCTVTNCRSSLCSFDRLTICIGTCCRRDEGKSAILRWVTMVMFNDWPGVDGHGGRQPLC
jgi:hypothetical protein